MKKNSIKHEGFTLVELLIVIVVIGVLSAMMMLSSTEAVSSAKAADIVSDLRNLKTAALAFYADNLASADKSDFSLAADTIKPMIWKYMNSAAADEHYKFEGSNTPETWFVYYDTSVTGNQVTPTVSKKLESRAKSTGLLKEDKKNPYVGTDSNTPGKVYMFIR